ncbi:putative RNA helicase SDE3, P-loop containing nucleoside triphosphate hydrolase [Rosa chinensis]|uniref:Putative RNA helicase SDE3, P-loop containing nucleoside triphosphate hydrolase n=1 Tax=Rosa chinensis TaxID=74649 RepID=A0A2P6R4S1_ROSCH|nr:probable RNA helicase SDE3 [Rosa chinensis]XP_024197841.1 probable RNA helicase SDE3 [Rosa chinensis]XP_040375180.1 probable RNA helicase SDE3 [Rosa chinensis]PRQ41436.1 putative RNA helicase SDE3, P-loop containing nucleoside triphosphate hydrolase [Rosa chinensis]
MVDKQESQTSPPRNKWSRFIPFSSSPQPRPDGVWLNRYWLLLVIGSSAILWLTNKNRKPRPPPETKGVASLKSHLSVSQHHLYPASPKTPTYFSGPSPSSPKHPPTYFSTPSPSPSSLKPPAYTSKPSSSSTPSSPKPAPSIYFSLSSPSPSSPKRPPVFKSVLCPASSFSNNDDIIQQQRDRKKTAYVCVEEDSLPVFTIPEDIKTLIKNETVPKVLNCSLSPTTYKDYFAALLYSEDFFLEKWSDFLLKAVTLELNEAEIHKNQKKQDKAFVAFELDSVPQNRPFLLSRDLVFARPVGRSTAEPFQGIINRIVRSKTVLVEFEDAFYTHHHSNKKYDVSFSFNRVCLKRAHQAVKDASEDLFQNFLFPHCDSRGSIPTAPALLSTTCHKLDRDQRSAVGHILRIQGSPPYVVTGPDSVPEGKSFAYFREPSRTGVVVSEAVYQLCQKSPEYRILICAPTNSCCDVLMRSLGKVIPESTMFRANAAFREKEEVPEDILRSSLYKESCFSCPPIEELRKYRVIFSTFMSSFRLHDKGIAVGHFSHIFLVDASSAIEPETLVALTNFADKTTSVIVTGKPGNSPRWVRADIARKKGLKISYFERLCKLWPYRSLSPVFITQLDLNQNSGSDYQTAF